LALPYGSHNEHVRQTASRAGYEAVFTVEGKSITSTTSMDSLGRYIVFSSKPNIFADAIRFGDAPASGGATAAQVDSSTIETEPPDGSVVTEAFPVLKANLAPFGNIDAESVQMRISGFGIVPAQYDPASKILTFRLKQNLQEKEYSVIVSFHADGRRMETRWKFTFSGARQAR
jgi:hypothetical protein